LKPLDVNEVHLLTFHQYGKSKYINLGTDYSLEELELPSDEDIKDIQLKFISSGFDVIIGGE